MAEVKKYVMGRNRLSRCLFDGFELGLDGAVRTVEDEGRHVLFMSRIDSAENDCSWGRLVFGLDMEDDMVLIVRAWASNDSQFIQSGQVTDIDSFLLDKAESVERKERLFVMGGCSKFVGSSDVVLYEQTGRYLWLYFELLGAGRAAISNIRVYTPGDSFYRTFPEIYRTNGEFFHRYLSVFSSLYSDLQEKIDALGRYIDVDTAPAELLPAFAKWMGIELDGNFLDEARLRKLLKIAYPLIKLKGTRQAIEGVVGIFTEGPVYIVEQHDVERYVTGEDRAVYEKLYGRSRYRVTVLINGRAEERLHSQLKFLLEQFKPVRSTVNVVFLEDCGSMDSYCFLDVNARVTSPSGGSLDLSSDLDGMVYLEE